MKNIENLKQHIVLEIMERLDFFDAFSDYEKERITRFYTNFYIYEQGEYLIKEGSRDTSFFILLSGTVSVTKGVKKLLMAKLDPGDIFGEVTFLTDTQRRTSNVFADDTVIVIKVDRGMLRQLSPEIREKIKDRVIEKLVKRLDYMNKEMIRIQITQYSQ
jgi:CRP/FNR family transcriptional regulator, cyclic AMP receptor protein